MRRLPPRLLPLLLMSALVLAVGACAPAAGVTPTAEPTATTAPTEPALPAATVTTAAPADQSPLPTPATDMATFTDPQAGYSIDYPADWYIYPGYGGVTVITTLDPSSPGRGGVPSDETKIDVVPNPAGEPETLEVMAERIRTETQVLSEEEIELLGGIPAVRMEFSGNIGGHMAAVLAVIEGTSVQVQGYGNLEPFDQVALTLRPAEPDATPPPPSAEGCVNVAPFSDACQQYPRPEVLAEDVEFLGALPVAEVGAMAWSPDGRRLAYAVSAPQSLRQRLEVRELPDFAVTDRWFVDGAGDLAWTPDGEGLAFTFPKEDFAIGIALARLGETDWTDLMPETGRLSVSDVKQFVEWLDEDTVTFALHCGTGCESLYALDTETGELVPLVNVPDEAAPYSGVFATTYDFSPDGRWLAATSFGRGLGEAVVLPWPGPGDPVALGGLAGTEWTQALGWAEDALLFAAYPGDPSEWGEGRPVPWLFYWQPGAEVAPVIAEGAYSAALSPDGTRLAVAFLGEPSRPEVGPLTSQGDVPHAAMLSWPDLELLGSAPLGEAPVADTNDLFSQVLPVWSPDGSWVIFVGARGGALAMDAEGQSRELVSPEASVTRAAWGDGSHLALLVDGQVWVVRLQPHR